MGRRPRDRRRSLLSTPARRAGGPCRTRRSAESRSPGGSTVERLLVPRAPRRRRTNRLCLAGLHCVRERDVRQWSSAPCTGRCPSVRCHGARPAPAGVTSSASAACSRQPPVEPEGGLEQGHGAEAPLRGRLSFFQACPGARRGPAPCPRSAKTARWMSSSGIRRNEAMRMTSWKRRSADAAELPALDRAGADADDLPSLARE